MTSFQITPGQFSLRHSLMLLALACATAQAAPITFATPANITADADVLTTGGLVYAYSASGAVRVVNGVSFSTASATAGGTDITFTSMGGQSTTAFTSSAAPFSGLSANYKGLLQGGTYNGTANSTGTVTLKNLTPGRLYTLQLWVGDPRSGTTATRTQTITSTGGNSQILDFNVGNAGGGVGQYVIGTFTADATTQSFTLAGANVPQVNALQLREPAIIWSGEVNGTWDETTTNFSGVSFATAKTLSDKVRFGDTSESGAAVTQSNVTVQAGGVIGANVNVSNSAVDYTFTSTDATGISGPVTLTKSGTGRLTLAGANTFTGATSLTDGILTLANSNALQSSPLSITGGALEFSGITSAQLGALSSNQLIALSNETIAPVTLTVGGTNQSTTFSGELSGAGTLVKTGTGILTFSGLGYHLGGTTVNAGKVAVTGTGTLDGKLTLAGGDVDFLNGSADAISLAALTQSAGKLSLDLTDTASDTLMISGNYTFTGGSIELVMAGSSVATGTPYMLVSYSGTLTGTPPVNLNIQSRTTMAVNYGTGSNSTITAAFSGGPIDLSWTGANGSTWENGPAANWSNGSGSDRFYHYDRVTFGDGPANTTPVLNGTVLPGAVTFDHSTSDYLLSGSGTIAGPTTLTKLGTGKLTIATANTYTGVTTVSAGTVKLSGSAGSFGSAQAALAAGTTLELDHSGDFSYSTPTSGAGGLVKLGAGTTTLGVLNTYTGGTTISAGTLKPGVATAIPSGAGQGNVINNGKLDLGGLSITVNGLSGTGVVDKSAAGSTTLTIGGNSASSTFDGTIKNTTGTLNLTKTGGGTITLTGTNTYSGTTTVASGGGTLIVTSPAALGSGPISIPKESTSTGTLALAFTGTNTISNTFVGFHSTNFAGDATPACIDNLSGDTTISAPLTVTATGGNGVYLKSSGGFLTLTGNITQSVGTVRMLGLGGAGDGLVSGNILTFTGGMSVTKDGTGTWTFTGANTYNGTAIRAGTLQIGNGGTSGTLGTDNVTNAGTLAFNRIDDVTVNNIISGAGAVEQRGSGKVTLGGANTYTGPTRVLAGTIATTAAFLGDTSAVSIASTAKLSLGFTGTDTVGTLTIGGVQKAAGTYGATGSGASNIDDAHFAGSGTLTVTTGPSGSGYDMWLASFPALTTPADKATTADPDRDGFDNLGEFALDGDPTSGAVSGKVAAKIATIGTDAVLTLTLPVLTGAIVDPADPSGGPLVLTKDGVKYTIQSSTTLTGWPLDVTEVSPALTSGLPSLGGNYVYRTFRTAVPLPGSSKSFLRVAISQ